MTVQEVEKLIETELATFNLSKFIGTLPKDMIANFKKALLEVAPSSHQMRVKTIKGIIKKKETELSFMEVGMVVNAIQAAPLYVLSDDLDSALIKFERIEEVRIEWNGQKSRKESELIEKKKTMMQLAGAGGNNGRIISMPN